MNPADLERAYKDARVCVTGGAGFIGSHLCAALVELGAEVSVIDDLSSGSMDNLEGIAGRIRFVGASLLDPAALVQAVQGAELIFHEAALTSVPASVERPEVVSVDTGGGTQIMRAAIDIAAGDWILQLGSFGNAANAARLVKNLRDAGWNAYQEKLTIAENTFYRVRAGAWSSKQEAAEAGTRIGALFKDLDVSVRSLGSANSAPGTLSGWMVQVGSFAQKNNAYSLRDRLRDGGLIAHVEAFDSSSGAGFKVLLGPELDRAGAQLLRERLRQEFELNGIIVNHP